MLNGQTELHIFDRGSVIKDRYCEEVLLPHGRLFRGAIGPDFIFMDDNARPHQTLAVEELLESEDITRMDWPAYSLDLNPIEHVWDALERRIAARLHHLENTQQLKQMLIEEWVLLPQEMLHQLVLRHASYVQEHPRHVRLVKDKRRMETLVDAFSVWSGIVLPVQLLTSLFELQYRLTRGLRTLSDLTCTSLSAQLDFRGPRF
ncbi:transposable element Tcb2 transposase [Trichonephila clavipes]|nr:transposable element Tcb2 transposase [Trichonephila clavipes]